MTRMKTMRIPQPCQHLTNFRSRYGPHPFRALQDCIRPGPMGRASIHRRPGETPRCVCPTRARLYACVLCAAVACHAHASDHADVTPGHDIAVDVDRAELFCCRCRDQVYDPDFDSAVVAAAAGPVSDEIHLGLPPENIRKRRRVDYRAWDPNPKQKEMVEKCSSVVGPMVGLRGLNNMGSTCFMNSVLQAMLHTPPLRNYFLSDRHNRFLCQRNGYGLRKRSNGSNGTVVNDEEKGLVVLNNSKKNNNNKKMNMCLACDLDGLFSAFFCGDSSSPFTPAKLLYSWWQHAENLATYEQQDAHEFFISMLDGIHEKVSKDRTKLLPNQGSGDCCIAHRVFSGILRSDVMCMACGFTSTTYDPCVDISLDLEPTQSVKGCSSKSRNSCNGEADPLNASLNNKTSTLTGCLDRFTRPERLGPDQKFFCQQCQVRQESLKQMSIRKLPLVSCFHIKRFEHSLLQKTARKVDRYLQFPFSLDMAPYLSSSILRSRFGNRILFSEGEPNDGPNELSSEFELFAVISHTGKLNAGHYVTYVRLSNQWYKCDDAWITQVNESIVRAAQGYMMFYVQKMFYYKPNEASAPS